MVDFSKVKFYDTFTVYKEHINNTPEDC
jgi:hypothetical protein